MSNVERWLAAFESEIKSRGLRIEKREPLANTGDDVRAYRYVWTDGTDRHWQCRIWEPFTGYPENNNPEQIRELVDHYMRIEGEG